MRVMTRIDTNMRKSIGSLQILPNHILNNKQKHQDILMTFQYTKTEMLRDAVEHYIESMKECNANQAAIDVYTELLEELESYQPETFGPTGLVGDPQ